MFIVFVFFATVGFGPSSGCYPEVFRYGDLCALYPASNILDMHPNLDNEVECQNRCVQDPLCNHWMFQKTTTGRTSCFLLTQCNVMETSCADTPDCQMTILGPKKPLLSDACCIGLGEDFGFADMTCKMEDVIDRFSNVADRSECQRLCRATHDCRAWVLHLYDDICLLCRDWGRFTPDCSYYNGPAFPDISSCDVFTDGDPCP